MAKQINIFIFILITLAICTSGCYYDNEEELYPGSSDCDTSNVTYSQSLAPVFSANCNACHSGNSPSGNIRTDSYTSVSTNISRIRGAVNHESGYSPMPQDGGKLSECDLTKIDIWIQQGMPEN